MTVGTMRTLERQHAGILANERFAGRLVRLYLP